VCAHCHACKENAKQDGWCRQIVATRPVPVVEDGPAWDSKSESHCRSPVSALSASSQQQVAGAGNCAPALLSWTCCSSRKCSNKISLGKRICIRGIANGFGQGPVCLKFKSSFQLSRSYVLQLKIIGASLQPGHCSTIG
jgi:hypothetical protein